MTAQNVFGRGVRGTRGQRGKYTAKGEGHRRREQQLLSCKKHDNLDYQENVVLRSPDSSDQNTDWRRAIVGLALIKIKNKFPPGQCTIKRFSYT